MLEYESIYLSNFQSIVCKSFKQNKKKNDNHRICQKWIRTRREDVKFSSEINNLSLLY